MNWQHLRAILWVRSRLSRHQWRRAGKLAAALRVLFAALGVVAIIGGTVGGFALGAVALRGKPPWFGWLGLAGLGGLFLFIWMIGVAAEVQRAESISLQRLLHLPVSLGQIFAINYLASLLTPSFLIVPPTMLGLAAGLTAGQGPRWFWAFPVILSFLFVVTAWTYCLRGWLVSLMVNKRRRRTIFMVLTFGVILGAQVPNIVINNPFVRDQIRQRERIQRQERQLRRRREARPNTAADSAPASPAASSTRADDGASTGRGPVVPWWILLTGSISGFLLGAAGLQRAYSLTIRFYLGRESGPRRSGPVESATGSRSRRDWLTELRLPGCSDELSAMAGVFWRSALRAPETKMALIMPVVLTLVFGSMHLGRGGGALPQALRPLVVLGVAALALMGVTQLAANIFGADRGGFRALVLLPVARRRILLAKNLALLPLAAGIVVVLLGLLTLVWRLSAATVAAGILQFLAGYLLLSIVGNYTSIRSPYRIAPGSLKPTKMSATSTLLMVTLHLLFPVAMLPLTLPLVVAFGLGFVTSIPFDLLNLGASLLLLAGAAVGYRSTLVRAGHYLHARERQILATVTSEVE